MENTELEGRLTALEKQSRQLCTGVSALVTTVCVLLGLWNLYQALSILKFAEIYDQMLDGKALPKLSQFVVDHPTSLFYLSLILPVAAIAVFCTRGKKLSSLWILLAILLITTLQLTTTRFALWIPLTQIISDMSSP